MPFRLRYMAHDLELPVGEFVVGRSTECQLSLDDPLVSRRHAVLRVRRDGVTVQDFGSRNGVLINGTKIVGERELAVGDKISIGSQEMLLQAATDANPLATSAGEEVYRRATQTLGAAYVVDLRSAVAELAAAGALPKQQPTPPPPPPSKEASSSPPPPKPPSQSPDPDGGSAPRAFPLAPPGQEATRSVQSFGLLGGVADKALAMGKAEEAERILHALLMDTLTKSRDGVIETNVTEPAARYAARLAGATGKASWVEYVFELYRRQKRMLPAPIIDDLYNVVRKVKNLEPAGIRSYLEVLREVSASAAFGPAERFLLQRVEGLERQIALK
jgi:predicted component of type VI protein secretion system